MPLQVADCRQRQLVEMVDFPLHLRSTSTASLVLTLMTLAAFKKRGWRTYITISYAGA